MNHDASPCDDHLRHPQNSSSLFGLFLQHVWYIHRTSIGFTCLIPSTSIFSLFFVDFWQVLGRWRDEGDGEAPGIFRLGRNTGVVVSEKGGERGIHIDWPPTLAIFLENMTVCSKGMTMDDRHGNIGQEKISKIRCLDEFWAVNLGLQPTNYADWSCKHGDGTWAWSWYRGRPRSMWMFIAITLNEHGGSAPSGMTFFETIEVILLFGCKNNGF